MTEQAMTEARQPDHAGRHWLLQPGALFQGFKYAGYALLIVDFFLFLRLEWAASDHTFAGGVSWTELTEAFSATIDTGAWVVLLLIFELQTYVIPEEKLRGGLAWTLNALLAVSYALIVWAFYGYCAKTWLLYDVSALLGASGLCDLPGDGWALLTGRAPEGYRNFVVWAGSIPYHVSVVGGRIEARVVRFEGYRLEFRQQGKLHEL